MARKIDKQSKRQKVFAYLDAQTQRDRADVVADVMKDFEMAKPYAMTLYQTHRKQSKATGALVEVFSIRDHKEGVTVDPYVFSKHVAQASVGTGSVDVNSAVMSYKVELAGRLKTVDELNK